MNIEEFSKRLASVTTFGNSTPSPLVNVEWLKQGASVISESVREFDEFGTRKMKCYSEQLKLEPQLTAKAYFVAKSLDELMESAYSIVQLVQKLPVLSSQTEEAPYVMKAILGLNERNEQFINRRLFELLVLVLNFQTTTDESFFKHFVLLTELQEHQGRIKDEQDFFGLSAAGLISARDPLLLEIVNLEQAFSNLNAAWYLKRGANYRRGIIFESYRQLLIKLDGSVSDLEKIALGFTYGAMYSYASKLVHFTASEPYTTGFPDLSDIMSTATQRVFMCVCILKGLTRFSNSKAPGSYAADTVYMRFSTDLGSLLSQTMYKAFAVGDFVSILDSLAEVTEEIVGKFDYKSYKVMFLARAPQQPDESYIASHLRFFANETLIRSFLDANAPDLLKRLNEKKLDEQQETIRKIAVYVWEQFIARMTADISTSSVQTTATI